MSGTFNSKGELDPSAAAIISCYGSKGSGKSVVALMVLYSWPYDAVVVDVAGDDGPIARPGCGQPRTPAGPAEMHDVIDVHGPVDELPRRWPEHLRREGRPMILHYAPDAGSSTFLEDMDAMVGLAYAHSGNPRPCLLVVHEIGLVAPAGRTPTHMRRVLNHSRHRTLTAVFCGPRPKTVDPLVVAQSDLVYTFDVPNPDDRKRIAEEIGWDPSDFDAAWRELQAFEYLLFDRREAKPAPGDKNYRLTHQDPLPEDLVDEVVKWAKHPTLHDDQAELTAQGRGTRPGA